MRAVFLARVLIPGRQEVIADLGNARQASALGRASAFKTTRVRGPSFGSTIWEAFWLQCCGPPLCQRTCPQNWVHILAPLLGPASGTTLGSVFASCQEVCSARCPDAFFVKARPQNWVHHFAPLSVVPSTGGAGIGSTFWTQKWGREAPFFLSQELSCSAAFRKMSNMMLRNTLSGPGCTSGRLHWHCGGPGQRSQIYVVLMDPELGPQEA